MKHFSTRFFKILKVFPKFYQTLIIFSKTLFRLKALTRIIIKRTLILKNYFSKTDFETTPKEALDFYHAFTSTSI